MHRSVLWSVMISIAMLAGCKKQEEAFEVLHTPEHPAQLQRYWLLPAFSLTERSGKLVTLADLQGNVWVADFFYTTCPGPCPMMASQLSDIHKATRTDKDLLLVSISTDPSKDTPDVLKQYASKFGADERWLFMTGEKEVIYNLANKGFKLGVSDEGGSLKEPVTHSTKLTLIDRNGFVRGFYDSQTAEEGKRLVLDIKRLLKETR